MIPFTYLCPWLLSSAFVRFWFICIAKVTYSTVFHLLTPPSVEKRKGFFFPPKHSTEKFFRKFFQIYPKRLFADFLARICDEGNGCLPLAIGGGVPFFVGLWASLSLSLFPFPFLCSAFLPCGLAFLLFLDYWEHLNPSGAAGLPEHIKQGAKGAN